MCACLLCVRMFYVFSVWSPVEPFATLVCTTVRIVLVFDAVFVHVASQRGKADTYVLRYLGFLSVEGFLSFAGVGRKVLSELACSLYLAYLYQCCRVRARGKNLVGAVGKVPEVLFCPW